MARPLTPDNQTLNRAWTWQDGLIILALIALIFWIVNTAAQFTGQYDPTITIELSPAVLPSYTAQTLLRMLIAYIISLVFSILYSYIAYYNRTAEKILLPLLDILQSIPVLSFLPGVVLALIALFPGSRIGVELAAIILIYTGMAWNMTFSFYQSLISVPRELREVAKIYRLGWWQQVWTLDLPAGAIGLIWNSVMSVAGGWFFLMAIESFTIGEKTFTLPGLGSYLAEAANQQDYAALAYGLAVLIGIIIVIDILVWRPLIAWGEKFKMEMVEAENVPKSFVLDFLRRSPTLRAFHQNIFAPAWERLDEQLRPKHPRQSVAPQNDQGNWPITPIILLIFAAFVGWGAIAFLRQMFGVSWQDWQQIGLGAVLTTVRVAVALVLSLLWTVPVGVAIGRNPRAAQVLQPIVQIAASVPATALFPVLLLALANVGGGLEIGSVALMMLGTMWYILFNVIAGAQAIPTELFEAAVIYQLSWWQRWRTLILPGIFPYLITGIITAVGGAWNSSIVSEYVEFQNQTEQTLGLGATISEASVRGDFPLLMAATAVMSLLVVLTNRLVWRPLYRLAETKYQLL
ncbi:MULTISPECIES: ABC transporter permease subunit [unclassified Thermosynechococcus]|uniref:ABC transporter permease n=1 Tax=unclassified Thermosynechococcus TaxID=2622553 RepID=UPI002873E125|nr:MULTISPECIES: ABC transporter permease subunit [unclassified Thermosynechococcus]WNC32980.1 ABC transporter permease subunit [Thermosynechococcus sp. PKX95]WNC35506.1 ABC transporter permease subunit [Thermosynechococcus sp. PKX91]WNC38026.1 ABC transporter permease subunit [Thermosynechococcus sp. WL11]WNC40547.1 ABC transporter permease subunit [Thermosynechococcus sp. WL17]WNC43067.1 ABC transporter permease subunit [Thermosynechococcus sp. WL15]